MDDVVATTAGKVRGRLAAEGVRAFRGIPFAAPPFGALRLRAPRPAPPWDGVREAADFGPVPPQPTQATSISGGPAPALNFGADILTANVFTPEGGGAGRPVFVYIYGGAYTQGFANNYDPSELVRAGLVAVTFNYRVGFEGFGHAPGAPDNRGLLDQVAALRWVRENIAAFGGDPGNVTVAGESAGAGSVVALCAMPVARGLFRRAVAHSVPCEFISLAQATETGALIAAAAGVEATVDALAGVPPEKLVAAGGQVLAGFRDEADAGSRNYGVTLYSPVVDGEVLPRNPLAALRAGDAPDLLLLHTTEEFRLFTVLGLAPVPGTEEELAAVAAAYGMTRFAEYRAQVPDLALPDLYARFVTDYLFGEYTTRLAEAHAAAGGKAYLARFAWRSPAFGGALGACHALDLAFAFGLAKGIPTEMFLGGPAGPAEHALAGRMVRAWVDFATTGDPGWPAATPDRLPVKIWDTEDDLVTDTGDGLRALWRDFTY